MNKIFLDGYSNFPFSRGKSFFFEAAWVVFSGLIFSSWFPGSGWRVFFLRLFGAKIGRGVVIKPHVRIKFPWRLVIGDYSWIGESAWIDNLDMVVIGSHTCISQGAYLCTGSHNWKSEKFELTVRPISIGSHSWICAYSKISLGVTIGDCCFVGFGKICTKSMANGSELR